MLLNIDDKAIENAAIAAEMKNEKISADEIKLMSNVMSESKPSILIGYGKCSQII